jgi:tetratricopeptide (TPR) repeat protein
VRKRWLGALAHLPEQRDAGAQAIDLRLSLRPLGEFGRILACLREAESLAAGLDDPRRLGEVSLFLSNHFHLMGAYNQVIAAAQRVLALATASGDVVLHALANRYLGDTFQMQGDYRRAIDCLGQIAASLEGTRATSPSVRESCPLSSPISTSPSVMPSWGRSLKAGPSGKKGCGLPR